MRLFIAINFQDQTRACLAALRDQLRARSQSGDFSQTENLHLTLAFLGECDKKQANAAKIAIKTIAFAPFEISIERVGHFKHDGGDLWWAGLAASERLVDLQSQLAARLTAAGFKLEKRLYQPHITLARQVISRAAPWGIEPFGETVNTMYLMKSERLEGRLRYTEALPDPEPSL